MPNICRSVSPRVRLSAVRTLSNSPWGSTDTRRNVSRSNPVSRFISSVTVREPVHITEPSASMRRTWSAGTAAVFLPGDFSSAVARCTVYPRPLAAVNVSSTQLSAFLPASWLRRVEPSFLREPLPVP